MMKLEKKSIKKNSNQSSLTYLICDPSYNIKVI